MKLEGIVTSIMSGSLYLVFEYMEHDLSELVARGFKFSEPQVLAVAITFNYVKLPTFHHSLFTTIGTNTFDEIVHYLVAPNN